MKKVFALIALTGMITFGSLNVQAQNEPGAEPVAEVVDSAEQARLDSIAAVEEMEAKKAEEEAKKAEEEAKAAAAEKEANAEEEAGGIIQTLKTKFIDGGPVFMTFVVAALILGLALSIERIIYLNMATTNTEKLLSQIEAALKSGGVEAAKEVCRNTKGPVASIFYQGLDRADEGIEMVEKSVVAYGGVQMGLLEKGLSWIQLFIALAPMLGFLGTVIGMIDAFDTIAKANNIEPAQVAVGIKVALITTVSGLIVAIILQVLYNYIVSKIDGIVNQMEDASISLIDLLYQNKKA